MKQIQTSLIVLVLASIVGFPVWSDGVAKDTDSVKRSASRTQATPATQPAAAIQAAPTTTLADSLDIALQALRDGGAPAAAPAAGEEINWSVIGAGGQAGTSTNWIVAGTVGQTAIGSATSINHAVHHGFWQDFTASGPGCCVGIVGDANGDGDVEPSLGDIAVMIDAKFISYSCDAIDCLAEADANQSGGVSPTCADISLGDIALLIDYLFITGPSLGIPSCL